MDQELLRILACPACRGSLEVLPLPGQPDQPDQPDNAPIVPGSSGQTGQAGTTFSAQEGTQSAEESGGVLPAENATHGPVLPGKVEGGLCCAVCAVVYPVSGGIPVLLKEEAVPRSLWDMGQLQKNKHRRK